MDEWLSPADEGWIAIRAMYLSMRKAGFSRFEACLIVVLMMHTRQGVGEEEE